MTIENGDKSSALFLTIDNPQSDNNVLWKERSLFPSLLFVVVGKTKEFPGAFLH